MKETAQAEFTIYANGTKAKQFNIGLPLLSVFCIVIAVYKREVNKLMCHYN